MGAEITDTGEGGYTGKKEGVEVLLGRGKFQKRGVDLERGGTNLPPNYDTLQLCCYTA